MNAITFRDVRLALGDVPVLDGLDFAVAEGEFLCLLGPSGCGKSTSLRIIGGLIGVDRGEVTVDGLEVHVTVRDTVHLQLLRPASVTVTESATARAAQGGP